MHGDNLVPQLSSCFKETISTALGRYQRLNLLESQNYPTQGGARRTLLQSKISNKSKIAEFL